MDSSAVVADRGPYVRFERGPESEMPPDAEVYCANFGMGDTRMLGEVIERRAPILIEMRHWGLGGILHSASSPTIIERDDSVGRDVNVLGVHDHVVK
jgi:hypothetical protein